MKNRTMRTLILLVICCLAAGLLAIVSVRLSERSVFADEGDTTFIPYLLGGPPAPLLGDYIVIGWNDLGMHCYDLEYSKMAVLPPYNTLWAQVIRRGDPPVLITQDVTVEYSFPDNTYSVGKTKFWDYEDKLFGVSLAPNIGLTGKGLSGTMDLNGDHFVAEGIPITEFSDSDLVSPDYLQLAKIVVKDQSGQEIASSDVVAPVSSEMRCDTCHTEEDPTDFRMDIL